MILRARNRQIRNLGTPKIGLFVDDQPSSQWVSLPAGTHNIEWRAETQLDPVMDVIVPAAFLGYNVGKYGAAFADDGIKGARLLAQNQTWKETMIQWGIKGGFLGADQFGAFDTQGTVTHSRIQQITVHDVKPPILEIEPGVLTLEATDFGGVLTARVRGDLRDRVTAYDQCGRPHSLGNDAPRAAAHRRFGYRLDGARLRPEPAG